MKQFGGQFVFESSSGDYDVTNFFDVYEARITERDLEIDVKSFVSF